MTTRILLAAAAAMLSSTAFAGPAGLIFSLYPNVASGPNGTPTADFDVVHNVPGNHAELIPQAPIGELDFQWFFMPLSLPISDDAGKIQSVTVCMQTNGDAYISQTRLTQKLVPGPSTVIFDDGTDRTSATGTCYTAVPSSPISPGGQITLGLKVVMPNVTDSIEVSGGLIRMVPR